MGNLQKYFVLVSVLFSQTQEFATASTNENPKLTFEFLGPDWQKLSFENGNVSLYSSKGDDIFALCQAPYPIQWNISGIIRPVDIAHFVPPRRDLLTGIYELALNIFFLDAEKSPELAASAIIACEKVDNYQVRDEVSVFVRGDTPLLEPLKNIVTDSFHIPCPTTDPTTPTGLFLISPDGMEALVPNVEYLPTKGFYSSQIFNGMFACRKGTFSVLITANETQRRTGSHFTPAEEFLQRFSDEMIEFECSSTTKSVELVFDRNGIETDFVRNEDKMKVARLRRGTSSPNETLIHGKAACVAEGQELIKEWTFEFIDVPVLHIDNFEGELDCLSPLSPKLVQSVRCKNSMDCRFMSPCLHNKSSCNFKKQKQFYADTDTYCFIDHLGKGKACASLPFSHLNGLAQCNVNGLVRQWEFFVSLEYARYTNWKDVPIRELVRIDDVSDLLSSAQGTSRFLCTSLAYLFADSLAFEIEYQNGTRKLMKGIDVMKYTAKSYPKIYELSYRVVLDIELSPDMTAITCIAPFWNSSESVKAEKQLLSAASGKRSAKSSFGESDEKPIEEKFHIGAKTKKLICLQMDQQNPVYQWHYKIGENSYMPVSQKFPEIKPRKGDNGEGILEFVKVGKQYAGIYQCSVNDASGTGTVTVRKYVVDVSAEPMSRISVTYSGVVIITLVMLAVAMAALAVCIRKQ